MAKISYDKSRTQDVLDQLNDANSTLNGTEQELQAAISTIKNARGIEYITGLDFSGIIQSPSQCQDYIKGQVKTISTRVQEIEEYNEDVGNTNFFLRGLATYGMVEAKLSEGFGNACESVVDGAASIVGWVAGLFSSKAKKSIGDFVAKDWSGDLFDNSFTRMLDKYSYMSADGTGAKILKGVGEAAGYVAILYFTSGFAGALGAAGGAAGTAGEGASMATAFANGARAAGSSVKAMATVTGIAGVGEGTESGLQQGLDYNKALTQGLKTGALSAATVVVTNYALNGLVKGAKLVKNSKVGTIATNAISKGVNKIKTPISKIASKVKTPISKAANKVKTPISKAANKVKTPISKAASKIKEPVSKATSKIKNTASKVTNKFTKGASTAEAEAAENAAAKGAAKATKGASAAENATSKGAAKATKGASTTESATAKGASTAENATAKGSTNTTNNTKQFTIDDNADDIIDAFKNGKMGKDEFKTLMENKAKAETEAYSKLEKQYG